MEIYLPFTDFAASAEALSTPHLVRQIDDILTVLGVIHETLPEWREWETHPLIPMWRGYDAVLATYGLACIEEAFVSGRLVSASEHGEMVTRKKRMDYHLSCAASGEYTLDLPSWWGEAEVHRGYASALLRRDAPHYNSWFRGLVPMNLPVVWPEA